MVAKYNFTEAQESEMVGLYQNGSSAKEIREAYSVASESTIYSILHKHNVPLKTRNHIEFTPAKPDMVERAFGKREAVDVDEKLPERKTERKRFRLTLKVRLTLDSDSMEDAIAKAKGYNGFQEVLSVSRVG